MNAIVGSCEALTRGPADDNSKHLDRITSSVNDILYQVDQLIDISRIETGKLKVNNSLTGLSEILSDVYALTRKSAAHKGIRYLVHIKNYCPKGFTSDEVRLKQIFINLVNNAIKFTVSGHVVVSAEVQLQNGIYALEFTVTDTGVGIESSAIAEIFTPFYQADMSIHRQFGGSGLGLNIVKELVHLLGGEISVHSEKDVGSTFCVSIPVLVPGVDSNKPPNLYHPLTIPYKSFYQPFDSIITDYLRSRGAVATQLHSDLNIGLSPAFIYPYNENGWHFKANELIRGLSESGNQITVFCEQTSDIPINIVGQNVLYVDAQSFITGSLFDTQSPLTSNRKTVADSNNRTTRERIPAGNSKHIANILIIDDQTVNLDVMEIYLRDYPVKTYKCTDVTKAMQIISTKEIHLIFLDLHMPGTSGFEVIELIRKQLTLSAFSHLYAFTADALSTTREKCIQYGFDGFLTKPLTADACKRVLTETQLLSEREDIVKRVTDHLHSSSITSRKLLTGLAVDLRKNLRELQDCIIDEDKIGVKEQVHAIKGAASMLGLDDIVDHAIQAEAALKSDQAPDLFKTARPLARTTLTTTVVAEQEN